MNLKNLLVFSSIIAFTACSDDEAGSTLQCGAGTTATDGKCVPVSVTVCGAGTTDVDGKCMPDGTIVCGTGTSFVADKCTPDSTLGCGSGTFENNNECVTIDPTDTAAPVTTADPGAGEMAPWFPVTLTSNEPAMIYYTFDGTTPTTGSSAGWISVTLHTLPLTHGPVTLQFFAEDPAGNTESVQSVVYMPNRPPAAASGLTATVTGADVVLAWTLPTSADLSGVIVARTNGGGGMRPMNGTAYAAADMLPGGGTVVFAGNASTFTDMAVTQTFGTYLVYAYDNFYGYGRPVAATYAFPVVARTGDLSVNLTTLVVTMNTQPAGLTVNPSGTATWAGVGNPMTIDLEVQNDTDRLLFNLKALVTAVRDSAASASGDGTYDGSTYYYMGPEALDSGVTKQVTITINGIAGTADPLAVDFEFKTHPMMFGSDSYYGSNYFADDSGGTGESLSMDVGQFGMAGHFSSSSGNSAVMHGVSSRDGRHIYFAIRNQPMIVALDTTTMVAARSGDLSGANNLRQDSSGEGTMGFTRGVTMSPDGKFLYVTLVTNSHNYECSTYGYTEFGTVDVVKVDRATLQVVASLNLISDVSEAQGRVISLSDDGRRGTLAIRVYSSNYGAPADKVHGQFFVFDTDTMTVIDGDPADGNQHDSFDLSAAGAEVHQTAISPDGMTVYAAMGDSGDSSLRVIDIATGAVTLLTPPTLDFTDDDTTELTFGPDGRLYWITRTMAFAIYDPASDTWVEKTLLGDARGIAFSGDGATYYVFNNSAVTWYDWATDEPIVNPATAGVSIPTSANSNHAYVVTPF